MGYFYAEFFRTRKSGGMKLYGIIPVDSGTACNCSVIGDKDGFHAIGLFHQLHSLFSSVGKTGCAECIPVHGDVTDDGYLIEMVLDRISGRGV